MAQGPLGPREEATVIVGPPVRGLEWAHRALQLGVAPPRGEGGPHRGGGVT